MGEFMGDPSRQGENNQPDLGRRRFIRDILFAGGGIAAGALGKKALESPGDVKEKVSPEALFSEEKEFIRMWVEETDTIPESIRQMDETRKKAWTKYEEIKTRLYAKLDASKTISGDLPEMQSATDELEKKAYENYLRYEEKNHE